MDLAAGAAGKGVDVVGATSLEMGTSGLMHLGGIHKCGHGHICTMTCTRYEPLLASQMTLVGSYMFLALLRTETVCPAKSGNLFMPPQQS